MATTKLPPYGGPTGRPPKDGGKWPPGPNEGDHSSSEPEWRGKPYPFPEVPQTEYNAEKNNYVTRYWDAKDGEYKIKTTTFDPNALPPGENKMSNKFLPFVVEKSTPLHMFKTLLSRSKGMNQVLIASMFNLILSQDIKILRKHVKELPEMPLEKLYEELLIKYPKYRVHDEVLAIYQTIEKFFPGTSKAWIDDLNAYGPSDVMLFFCGMAYAGKPSGEYTDFPYNSIMDADADPILENIQAYVSFSDKGTPIKFDTVMELRCFVLYHGLFRNMMDPDWEPETYWVSIVKVEP